MSEPLHEFETGAVRGTDLDARYDLIPLVGLRRIAATCAYGAERYGEGNWMRGIPSTNLLNHALAHVVQYLDGDRSEDHLAHAAWGLMAAMHNEERHPDMTRGLLGPNGTITEAIADALKRHESRKGDRLKS